MNDMRATLLFLFFIPFCSRAQLELSGIWKTHDGTSVYEIRLFDDGHIDARVLNSTRKGESRGRIVLDHIEAKGQGYKAVIHSAGRDVPREVILSIDRKGEVLDLEIPRPLAPVHIIWTRVGDALPVNGASSTLSLNE